MTDKKNHNDPSLKDELVRIFITSFSTFLFILFFQPFPLEMLEYNDRLLYVTGFGVLIFILASIVLVLFPILMPKWFKTTDWESGPGLVLNLLLLILSVTTYTFYIRFVGKMPLNLYIVFKAVLVCLLPIAALAILYRIKSLDRIIFRLQEKNKALLSRLNEFESAESEKEIIISSDNQLNKISLKYRHIIAVRSADNYIEVYYNDRGQIIKKLIRNTLKSIELKLSSDDDFLRCHRASIINLNYADRLIQSYHGYRIKMNGIEEPIPVSRQYLIQVKVALAAEK